MLADAFVLLVVVTQSWLWRKVQGQGVEFKVIETNVNVFILPGDYE